MEKNINATFIADLHIGAMPLEQTKKEFTIIEDFYNKNKSIDLTVIGGDFFDHKLYANSEYISFALYAMNFICNHSKYVRVVYGTKSHEWDQYTIFNLINSCDYKVIKHVMTEEILGFNILYLPEEHIYDKTEYYSKYFNEDNRYDYVFGHGVIEEVMTEAVRHTDQKTERLRVPIFKSSELSRICKGKVYFGHYHIYSNIDDKIFYCGSFSRYKFGEEKEKGFIYFKYNKKKYSEMLVNNTEALNYVTIGFGFNDKILYDENAFYDKLQKIKDNKNLVYDKLRIMVNIPEDHDNPDFILKILQDTFRNDDTIKVNIVNGYIKKLRETSKQKVKDFMNLYGFLFDKELPLEEKTRLYLIEHDNYELSSEKIKKYNTEKLQDILKE